MKGLLRPRSLGMILLALVMGAAVYGFAAANTVNPTYAGDGSAAINGYTVTNVDYILAGTPSDIDRVDITLNAAAGQRSTFSSTRLGHGHPALSAGAYGSVI